MAAETFRITEELVVEDRTGPGLESARRKVSQFDKTLQETQSRLNKMTGSKWSVAFNAVDKATSVITKVESKIKSAAGKAWNFTVGVIDKATAPIQGIFNLLKNPILQAGAVLGISVSASDAINTFSGFEATMSKVKAISGASGEDFENLTALAKEMGATTKFTAQEAAEGLTYTTLVNEVWAGEIAAKTINPATPNIISIKAVIPPSVGGFTIREAALFDDAGDMIAVCNMPEIAKATLPDGISSSLDIVMNILLSNVDAVEFIVNPTLDPASRDDLALAVAELREEMGDLAASVLANDVAASLETTSGDTIIARDGAELFAWQRRRENEPAGDMCANKDDTPLLFRLVDDMRADFKRNIQALTNAIMSGSLTAPLTGRTGAAITTRDSADIAAVKYL